MPTSASYKPKKYPFLLPYLTVKDPKVSIDFYEKAFGFEISDTPVMNEENKIMHAEMRRGEVFILMGPEGAYGALHKAPKTLDVLPSITLYIYLENVDAAYERAIKAGAVSIVEPQDSFWDDRFCKVSDLDGYEWMFATFSGKEV